MTGYVFDSSNYSAIASTYVHDGGSWKEAASAYVFDAGTWKLWGAAENLDPNTELNTNDWDDAIGGDDDGILFEEVGDPHGFDDSRYINYDITNTASPSTAQFGLSDSTVGSHSSVERHTMRMRSRLSVSDGTWEGVIVYDLVEDGSSLATFSKTYNAATGTTSFTTDTHELTTDEADSILTYDNLQIHLGGHPNAGDAEDVGSLDVSGLDLEII